jgi:hypothetical protein
VMLTLNNNKLHTPILFYLLHIKTQISLPQTMEPQLLPQPK